MTLEQIKEMRHAVGLDYQSPKRGKYKAYRNYAMYTAPHEIWQQLAEQGLAAVRIDNIPDYIPSPSYWYSLTQKGLDILGQIIGARIEVIR